MAWAAPLAKADYMRSKDIRSASQDAMADKNDADDKVAVETCGALAGNAQVNCITAAWLVRRVRQGSGGPPGGAPPRSQAEGV